jgi:hypothetical protein
MLTLAQSFGGVYLSCDDEMSLRATPPDPPFTATPGLIYQIDQSGIAGLGAEPSVDVERPLRRVGERSRGLRRVGAPRLQEQLLGRGHRARRSDGRAGLVPERVLAFDRHDRRRQLRPHALERHVDRVLVDVWHLVVRLHVLGAGPLRRGGHVLSSPRGSRTTRTRRSPSTAATCATRTAPTAGSSSSSARRTPSAPSSTAASRSSPATTTTSASSSRTTARSAFYLKTVYSGGSWSDDGTWSSPTIVTTNIPTGTSFKTSAMMAILKSLGTNPRLVKLGFQNIYLVPPSAGGIGDPSTCHADRRERLTGMDRAAAPRPPLRVLGVRARRLGADGHRRPRLHRGRHRHAGSFAGTPSRTGSTARRTSTPAPRPMATRRTRRASR